MKNMKILKIILIIIAAIIGFRFIVTGIALLQLRTCAATKEVTRFISSDAYIVEECGEYINSRFIVLGTVYEYAAGEYSGEATIKMKFTSQNGDYSIIAELTAVDDVWSVIDYTLEKLE